MSTHTNIALQLVGELSPDDLRAFEKEFSKIFAQKVTPLPIKTKKKPEFDYNAMAQLLLNKHRAKNNIRVQE